MPTTPERLGAPPFRRSRQWWRTTRNRARTGIRSVVRKLPPTVRAPVTRALHRIELRGLRRRGTTLPRPGKYVAAPEITVVVTSRDRSELLQIALRSVQRQDFEAFECIVVDADSTDDAVFAAQSFAAVDHRFRVLSLEVEGPSAARNAGLAAARAPFVCFLDDDDFLLAGSLRARLNVLREQPPDVASAFCDWMPVDAGVGLEAFRPRRHPVRRGTISFGSLAAGTPFILSAPLLRTAVLREVGGFDEGFTRGEDAELWFRLARLGFRFVDAHHVGIAYRRTPGSLVVGAPSDHIESLLEVYRRSDEADPSVAGRGPWPEVGPIGPVVLSHARTEQVLRYVAMVASGDPAAAVELGERALHPSVRRALDIDSETEALKRYVATRLAISGESELRQLAGTIGSVLRRLLPSIETSWSPSVDVAEWSAGIIARTRAIGPPPTVETAASVGAEVDGAVVVIPEARYHVDELGPLTEVLTERGVQVRWMVSPKTVPAALGEMGRFTATVLPYTPEAISRARALVTLNDWGPLKDLVLAAGAAGVPTFAKVEGVQDFDDVESTWQRRPYRSAAYILAQGENDVAALPEKETFVVGSSRLERLWQRAPVEPGDHALVNLNFTFQVLTDRRELWLGSVRGALARAGVAGLVSTHPAETGRVEGLPVAAKPFRHEITRAGMLVSRFSTVPFEAMARGVPFVYHNPHGERFPTFLEPQGAFPITGSQDELVAAVAEVLGWRNGYRARSAPFFRRQVDVDPTRPSAQRAADVIMKLSRRSGCPGRLRVHGAGEDA
jgi:hypothetical protein